MKSTLLILFLLLAGCANDSSVLTIATVNNSDMVIMQQLSSHFEEETGIELR